MTPKAKKALEGSIRKWERILIGAGEDQGDVNCPLCRLYNNRSVEEDCEGCPVKAKTGKRYCGGTPYIAWIRVTQNEPHGYAYSGGARRAALKMLRFLESLRR